MIQLLSPDGTLRADERAPLDVTPRLCRDLLRDMVLARRFDEEALALQRQGELGLWLMSLGQEAAQVGSVRALAPGDYVFPSYREHAAARCRGVGTAELLAQWRGVTHGGWDPARYRFHIYSLVLGTQTLHAAGYAVGVRLDGASEIVLAYFGDGASSQGDVSEALNWAAVAGAPVIFFCQNNQWAISTGTSRQMAAPLHRRAEGFGLEGHLVDGNDVLAVHAVTARAAESVRQGGRPVLIEATTYRMAGHSTSDDPRRYRSDDEVEAWRRRDPIARLERLVRARDWADQRFFDELEEEAAQVAAETRAACLALPDPKPEDIFRFALTEETELLREQREWMEAYRTSFTAH
ncbi:thiamine pyrophosphate-dependent dehydrogenase E1 component subunit alpha [Dactylosporangium sp. NPDC000555]|uniref:thiamine pyrophosphate-dependent dehydrogenase E1 component subunit alpha n=1 Tax=Dactylosporangium sp. NPDC000555 TaxID=3154260 RepID=UPI0033184382